MLLMDMLTWWYGVGWLHIISTARKNIRQLYYTLSVKQMLGTLFAPWKEDRMEAGRGLDQMMRAMVMNGVARLIGFLIRSIFIFIWLVSIFGILVGFAGLFIAWPLMPIVPIGALIYGLTGF